MAVSGGCQLCKMHFIYFIFILFSLTSSCMSALILSATGGGYKGRGVAVTGFDACMKGGWGNSGHSFGIIATHYGEVCGPRVCAKIAHTLPFRHMRPTRLQASPAVARMTNRAGDNRIEHAVIRGRLLIHWVALGIATDSSYIYVMDNQSASCRPSASICRGVFVGVWG